MARYDYRCTSCGNVFEVEHPMSERPQISCPACGSDCERVFEPSSISFKGSGFYNTDQRSSGSTTEATSGGSETAKPASTDAPACANCPHCK